ncbi:MAG: 2-amino-4-hydroxy-6-hydroxymethyldihydropteridine diphosphokinase [Planctomycetes bacterium]|nr:2-amino-4-hydroxy-6-hydroxymethyldihydropteridine diphosphokinase [Planctomycetota bacterium]
MAICLIGLGSNLGDRRRLLEQAVARFRREPEIELKGRSRWQETAPIGGPAGQGAFLNGAVVVATSLGPEALLARLKGMEAELGRCPGRRWGPRRIDLDLLLYGETVLETAALSVPHPRMAWRRFVLEPAAEVAAEMVHPTTGWTVGRLLEHLNTAVPYVAIAGAIGVGKGRLAEELAEKTSATRLRDQIAEQRLETFYADPSGNAWAMELEFLEARARLLSADSPRWSEPGGAWVSDFWFNQCLVYAGVWLPAERLEAFRERWEQARRTVREPKLTVLVDGASDRLAERVGPKGSRPQGALTVELRERIRQAILEQASRPGQGPLLRASADGPEPMLDEVLAAFEAMK